MPPASSVPRPLSRDAAEAGTAARRAAALGQRTGRGGRRFGRGGRGVRQVGGDIGAAAGTGAHIALRSEALIRQDDGLARHAKLFGKRAGRRQAGAGGERAGEDALPKPVEHRLLAALVWYEHRRLPQRLGPIAP